ncbi:MAG: esterase/lipase family protein [Gammaproteobacteria bacterium]
MSYETWRLKSIKKALDQQLTDLVARYRRGEPTLCLLPGGMGSQLIVSDRRYDPANETPDVPREVVWMDPEITTGDAKKLEIRNGRDAGGKAIAPSGPLRFPPIVEPYVFLRNFARDDKGWNYIPFGFDWRRPLLESAELLHYFLERYQDGVTRKWGVDPLPTTQLVGHSMGGLVALRYARYLTDDLGLTAPATRRWFDKIITVATPFYGTSTHIQRYYEGVSLLRHFYSRQRMRRIVGSLPGPYTLMYLPQATYSQYAAEFAADEYPLEAYPMRDGSASGPPADPYDPAMAARFPGTVSAGLLAAAAGELDEVTRRITAPTLTRRIFNIRSGRGRVDVRQKWLAAQSGDAPIKRIGRKGPGDGTVPAWAARLMWLDDAQVYNTRHADDHQGLPDHREVHIVLQSLIERDRMPRPIRRRPAIENRFGRPASRRRVEAFFEDIANDRVTRDDPRFQEPAIWMRVMRESQFT